MKLSVLQFLCLGILGLDVDHWGTYFLLSFPSGYYVPTYIVVVTAREKTDVIVILPSTGRKDEFELNSGEAKRIEFGAEVRARPYQIKLEKIAVSVISSRKVSVYGFSYENRYTEGFLVLPVASLGTEYMAVNMETCSDSQSQIVIVAAQDNTSVIVTLKAPPGISCWDNLTKQGRNSGDQLAFALNTSDVVNIYCDKSTTGSMISSNNPVAVITGNRKLCSPPGSKFDPTIEMLPPTKEFGTDFALIAPHGHTSGQALLCVVALYDWTSFTIRQQTYNVTKGENVYISLDESEKVCFQASDKVIVMLLMTGVYKSDDYDGDVYMSIIPPVNKATNDYLIPKNILKTYNDEYMGGIDIIALDSVTMDINPTLTFNNLCDGFRVHSYIYEYQAVVHYTAPSPFIVLVYGYANLEAYGFPAGMKVGDFSGAEECTSSPCQNGGWCLDTSDSFRCYCADPRYAGAYCEIDNCITNSCVHGNCIDHNDFFTWDYLPGYTGIYCDINMLTSFAPANQSSTAETINTHTPTTKAHTVSNTENTQFTTTEHTLSLSTAEAQTTQFKTTGAYTAELSTTNAHTQLTTTEDHAVELSTAEAYTTHLLTTNASTIKHATTETPTTKSETTTAHNSQFQTSEAWKTDKPTTESRSSESLITERTPGVTQTTESKTHTSQTTSRSPTEGNSSTYDFVPKPIYFGSNPCAGSLCLCRCQCESKFSETEILSNSKNRLNMLKIQTEFLSRTWRKTHSSENLKSSETNLGLSAVLLVILLFSVIVLMDLSRVIVWIRNKRKKAM